jgi:hypothetical protein
VPKSSAKEQRQRASPKSSVKEQFQRAAPKSITKEQCQRAVPKEQCLFESPSIEKLDLKF